MKMRQGAEVAPANQRKWWNVSVDAAEFTLKLKYKRTGINLPMTPKIPRIFGAKMTSRLMNVSRTKAMAMCRGQ